MFRHPCHFCLAFCATFIVVLAALVVQTVIDQGPVIFLSIAQASTGEIDVTYLAKNNITTPNVNNVERMGFLNYTSIVDQHGTKFNLAPRAIYWD